MYRARLSLQGIDDTITRPIVIGVLNDIKELINIDKDVPYIIGDEDQLDRSIDGFNNTTEHSSPRDEIVYVEYEENSNEGDDLSMLVNNPDTIPFYYDDDIHSRATAVQHRREVILTFRYYSKSKSNTNAIVNRLRMMTSNDSMYKVHDLEYHFNIPKYFLKLLLSINNLKNLDEEVDNRLTAEDYVDTTFGSNVDFVNSLDGIEAKSELGIREAQLGVLGAITSNLSEIKKVYVEEKSSWSIEFTYKLTYDKPIALLIEYPMTVYNRLIPKAFRIKEEKQPSSIPTSGRRSLSNQGLMDFVNDTSLQPITVDKANYYLKLPKEDSLDLPKPLPFTTRMFTVMTIVDRENPTDIFSLDEIPDLSFKPNILKLIEKESDYVGEKYGSLINFTLYDHGRMVNNKIIVETKMVEVGVDEETNQPIMEKKLFLKSTEPLSFKGNYRVSVSMVTDLSSLSTKTKKRIDSRLEEIDEEIHIANVEDFNARVAEGFIPATLSDSINIILSELNVNKTSDTNLYTISNLMAELSKFNISIPTTVTINDMVSIFQTYTNLIPSSLFLEVIANQLITNGFYVVRASTIMDFINVFSVNSSAIKNTSSMSNNGSVKDMETVLVENISEKTFTKQYTMTLSSLLVRK